MHARTSLIRFAVLTAVFCCLPVGAAEPLQYGEKHVLASKVMGEDRTMWVYTPPGYANSSSRYPVLYLTDGPGHFLHTTGTVQFLARTGRIPQMIVVGIANTDRTRDLTPTSLAAENSSGRIFPTSGGADRFLEFFRKELIPHIESSYRTEPYRVFSGHSLGGLFAVHAFLTHTDLFDAYLAVSPSLWWDDEICKRRAKNFFGDTSKLQKSLYLTLGKESPQMHASFDGLTDHLAKLPPIEGFQWDAREFPDEDHGSVVLRSHYHGLKAVFEGWRFSPTSSTVSLDELRAHYERLTKRFKFQVQPGENMINNLGYQTLSSGKTEEALSIFEYNVQLYPASANVYDSLGEAQEKVKKTSAARANYKKAWELGVKNNDPNTTIFKQNFERLKAKKEAKGKVW